MVVFFGVFFLFENTQPSGQQTNKMLNDIGSKTSTEKQWMGEGNSSQSFCSLVGFGFAIFFSTEETPE